MASGNLRGTGLFLLRAPVRPFGSTGPRLTALPGDPDEVAHTLAYVRALAGDTSFRESVALSSPALAVRWDRVLAGGTPPVARLRRLALALLRYRLRTAARPTPVGTFAGVALGRLTDGAEGTRARLGTDHRPHLRPDLRWLAGVVAAQADDLVALRGSLLRANDRAVRRGGRLVLDDSGYAAPHVSVRLTGAVDEALRRAALPVRGEDLEQHLRARFPTASAAQVSTLLRHLTAHRFLLTDLMPPPEAARPLDHVAGRAAAAGRPEAAGLREIGAALDAGAPSDGGALTELAARMRTLHAVDRPLHADLRLDADVTLPRTVADEAARAAEALWRMRPDRHHPVAVQRYHEEFLVRYGAHRLVPLRELLDPTTGLGRPAGYPYSSRPPVSVPDADPVRARVLGELLQEAEESDGVPEIRLGRAEVDRLARNEVPLPPGLELGVHLVARSATAVDAGDFTLVLSGLDSPAPGAVLGRFAHVFTAEERAAAAGVVAEGLPPGDPALAAQLSVEPFHPVAANVSRVPRWLTDRIPVDVLEPDTEGLTLADLAVGADARRLYVVSRSRDREVRPVSLHMLNAKWAPAELRLLTDIGAFGCHRAWSRWDWGLLDALPRLPRVRHGRTVLSPARWRLPERLCGEPDPRRWHTAYAAWRERAGLPDHVLLGDDGRDLPLDLNDPAHLRLLHAETTRGEPVTLCESVGGRDAGTGWLTGPDGGHRAELVLPLVHRQAPARTAVRSAAGRVRPAADGHLPGGAWLSAKLYAAEAAQPDLLATHLPRFLTELDGVADRWFYVRYRDPDPHLRLRLRTASPDVTRSLHAWAAALRADGLLGRLVLDTYDPERERYGGEDLLDAAEAVFAADSASALEQLALVRSGALDIDPRVLVAANHAAVCAAFLAAADPDGRVTDALLAALPRTPWHEALPRARALDLTDPGTQDAAWRDIPGGADVPAAWWRTAEAAGAYGRRLRAVEGKATAAPHEILLALLHMQHNRLHGIDRAHERTVQSLLRAALHRHARGATARR